MMEDKLNVLAISGSLRPNSSNTAIVQFIKAICPPEVNYTIYTELGSLPHFNDSDTIPEVVQNFHQQVAQSDGVLICTPEYAFGVPGVLKNALDWSVGLGSFDNKPVAMISAGTGGDKAHASLLLTLQAINANVHRASLNIPFVRSKMRDGTIIDDVTVKAVNLLLESFITNMIGSRNAGH